jgi:hypothetical protein
MISFANNNIAYLPPVSTSYSANASLVTEDYCASDVTLSDLKFGETEYKFFQNISVLGLYDISEGWLCQSRNLGNSFVGMGDTFTSAFEDFKNQLHVTFQRLYRKRPFEMSVQEKEQWNRLVNVIDVYHYRTTTPIVVREVGQISYGMISRPYRIKWLTGYNYVIDPYRVPPELMSLKPGQYIDAVVKRDPVTHKEIEILSVQSIAFHLPTEAEAKNFLETLPVARLAEGSWD